VAVFPRLGTISGGATKLLNRDTGGGSSDDDDDDDVEADFFFVGITDILLPKPRRHYFRSGFEVWRE
jgi:hypothetical protein